jgi:phosphoribosylamine-glycine ligase
LGFDDTFDNVLEEKWDLVVACNTYANRSGVVETFRANGVPTIGAGMKGFKMEEKTIGRYVFSESLFKCPRWTACRSTEHAIAVLKTGDFKSVVVKFAETNRPHRTMVCRTIDDAIRFLKKVPDGALVLEEIVDGCEIAFSAYFDGKKFVQTVTNCEHKHMFPGNMGILVPEMGTLAFYDPMPKIQELLDSLLDSATASEHLQDYRGLIDVNCMVSALGEVYALEFTCRFGVPISDIMTALLKVPGSSYGEFLLSVANGDADSTLLKHQEGFAVGANMVVCGYGYHEVYEGVCNLDSEITGLELLTCHHTLGDVTVKDNKAFTAHPWVGCIVGVGYNVSAARAQMLFNAKKIDFQDKVYRRDIGERFSHDVPMFFAVDLVSERTLRYAN